jgi:pimeloyl-ACP methyl ester carboxylesterase
MLVRIGDQNLEAAWLVDPVPGRPSIVLLHEGLGSIAMWRDFPVRLGARTGCGVFAYSRLGHGRSDPAAVPREPDYLEREATDVLPDVLSAAGIERPILFGHSDGGSIALVFAATFPEMTRGLILEAPHVFVEDLSVASIAAARETYPSFRDRLARYHDDADATFRGWNDIWLDPRFRSWSIVDRLDRISVPVLTIQGADDEYGTLAQLDAIEAHVPGARRLVIARSGHSPHRDAEESVLGACAAFVASINHADSGPPVF